MNAWSIPVESVQQLADPTAEWPWNSIPACEVTLMQLMAMDPLDRPLTEEEASGFDPEPHLRRVAWFVQNGVHDAIEVDVGCFGYEPLWPVLDGNHRLFAAIRRGDACIDVDVSGDLDRAAALLNPDWIPRVVEHAPDDVVLNAAIDAINLPPPA